MYLDSLGIGRVNTGCYSQSLPVARHLEAQKIFRFTKPVTIFTGDNGAGKSTLIEAIACRLGFDASGGVHAVFNGAAHWSTSKLHKALNYSGSEPLINGYFLRSETQYVVADYEAALNGLDEVPRSHGESIMDVVEGSFFSRGLFLLDEPEVGLSPVHQMALLGYIDMISRGGGQFIIATHSPIILGIPGAELWHLTDDALTLIDDYLHHPVYLQHKEIMADPQAAILAEMCRLL